MLRRTIVFLGVGELGIHPSSHVAIFPIHLDPPTIQHREIFKLLLGIQDHNAGVVASGSSAMSGCSSGVKASLGRCECQCHVPPGFAYMEPFAESLLHDSQLAPFDNIILVPNSRFPVSLRQSIHLAALAVLATRGLPNVHVDFTALEHPDESMPVITALTAAYPHSVIVHWLHDAMEMQNWRNISEMKKEVPMLLLQTQSVAPSELARLGRAEHRQHHNIIFPSDSKSAASEDMPCLRSRQYQSNLSSDAVSPAERLYYERAQEALHRIAVWREERTPYLEKESAGGAVTAAAAATLLESDRDTAAKLSGDDGSIRIDAVGDDYKANVKEDLRALGDTAAVDPLTPVAAGDGGGADAYVKGPWWLTAGGRGDDAVEVNKAYATSANSSWLGSEEPAGAGGRRARRRPDDSGAEEDDYTLRQAEAELNLDGTNTGGKKETAANASNPGASPATSATTRTTGAAAAATATVNKVGAEREMQGFSFASSSRSFYARRNVRQLIEELYAPCIDHPDNDVFDAYNRCVEEEQQGSDDANSETNAAKRAAVSERLEEEMAAMPLVEVHPVRRCTGADVRQALWEHEVHPGSLLTDCVMRYIESHGLYRDARKYASATSMVSQHLHGGREEPRGYDGVVSPPPKRAAPPKETAVLSLPGVIPRLELHYDLHNLLAREQYEKLKVFQCASDEEPDLIVPIGGDGYMMHCIREHWRRFIPFYGVNAGHLGYLLNDCSTLDELFSSPLKLHTTTMLYCQAERDTETGERTMISELAFNDAWIERASGQTALIRILVNGEERIRRLRGDGVLVSTAAGSTAYSQALGASPVPVGAPLIQVVGSNVVSPAQWRPTHLDQEDEVELQVIDTVKRPCKCYVDSVNVGNVSRMFVRSSRVAGVCLAFSTSCDLQHKLYQMQFPSSL